MDDYYWDIANATKMGNYLTKKESEIIFPFLEGEEINTCLDVACGSGRFSVPISNKKTNVISMDADLAPLRKLQDKAMESIQIIKGDANKFPFKKSSFDCIVSIQTVDYLDAELFFRNSNQLLKKNGFLLFTILNSHSYKKIIHGILSNHRTFYRHSYKDITYYLENEGFKVIKCIGYNWLPFKRNSNHFLFEIFKFLEDFLRLKHIPFFSPWIFFIVYKMGESDENSH